MFRAFRPLWVAFGRWVNDCQRPEADIQFQIELNLFQDFNNLSGRFVEPDYSILHLNSNDAFDADRADLSRLGIDSKIQNLTYGELLLPARREWFATLHILLKSRRDRFILFGIGGWCPGHRESKKQSEIKYEVHDVLRLI